MANFDDVDSVIEVPERFKIKLGIGEDAYSSLRMKKNLGQVFKATDAAGAAATGAGIAGSTAVASTFFSAPTFLGIIGIGAAVTPIGWIIAAGAASSIAYLGISRYLTQGKDSKVHVIPKWINTPMDVLAIGLFDFMAPLGFKVASADGTVATEEKKYIFDHFVNDWGYSKSFLDSAIQDVLTNLDKYKIIELTENLADFKKKNPDCNYDFMAEELKNFLNGIVMSDGRIDDQEMVTIKAIESILDKEKPNLVRKVKSQAEDFWKGVYQRVRSN